MLDWLATEFRAGGWDVKHIQRLIVTSATYRQSARVTPELLARDPENRLLARMTRSRLPAEFIRDQALAASGLLDRRVGGPSVHIYQPDGFWEELSARTDSDKFSSSRYVPSRGADLYRRSLYAFWKRTAPPPTLAAFDAPDREVCTVRRGRTNTPLQALVLLNDPTYVEAARKLAERVMAEAGPASGERISLAFRLCAARPPTDREKAVLGKVLDAQLVRFRPTRTPPGFARRRPVSARREVRPGGTRPPGRSRPVVLNLDETVTRN